MITSFLIGFGSYAVQAIIYLLPISEGLPSDVQTAITSFGGYVGILSPILPIATMATIFSLVIGYELAVFSFKALRWIMGFIPFVGKSA